MIKFITDRGIVINKKDFGEADRYITVFTENFGKVVFLIKGIRKSKKREVGAADTLNLSNFQFYKKGEIYNVTNFSGLDSYREIKENLTNLELAIYILSVLNIVLLENNRKKNLFNITLKSLELLKKNDDEKKNCLLIAYYLYYIIQEEGLKIYEEDGTFFSFENSKFVKGYENFTLKVSEKEKEIMLNIIKKKIKEMNMENYEICEIEKVIEIFEKYINYHFGVSIKYKKICNNT